ncbi:MAG: cytochrome c [Thermodesulfobacteriota bacterium]|nr:cytochrome c [Thermodesulfobacteriota bacterium]
MLKLFGIFAVFLLLFLFNSIPSSYSDQGEELFKRKCGACHGTAGEAPAFSPVKYASNQWKRFFDRDKHARKKDISNEISNSDILIIRGYLMAHAADSDLPIAAGLR